MDAITTKANFEQDILGAAAVYVDNHEQTITLYYDPYQTTVVYHFPRQTAYAPMGIYPYPTPMDFSEGVLIVEEDFIDDGKSIRTTKRYPTSPSR